MDDKTCTLMVHFQGVTDPRIDRRKLHILSDIMVIAICAVVGGANSFDEIEIFGIAHEAWLRGFLSLANGIPSHDTFERLFARINPHEFRQCFASWTRELAGIFTDVIALDGQTHRGARSKNHLKSPIHMVSAWAVGLRLVLAQTKVDEKSNEITAIPQVLKALEINGCIVTMDAMGCQQKIAQQIIDQGGNYILGLKGNQGLMLSAIEQHFSTTSNGQLNSFRDVDKGHGRIEIREVFTANADTILDLKEWPGLKSAVKVVSTREIKGVSTTEDRFYLSSLPNDSVKKIAEAIRSHWSIENSLHHVLDVTFDQDASRVRTGNATENFGVLRHIAMNILRGAPHAKNSTPSINLKRKRAGMDLTYLKNILQTTGLEKS